MELLSCSCSKECTEETCSCMQNKLKCTYMCKLVNCTNQKDDEADFDCVDGDEGEDEDDFNVEREDD